MTQFGQYPAPTLVIAHLSDTHFLGTDARGTDSPGADSRGADADGGDRALHGVIDTHRNLRRALEQLERSETHPAAIVFTGDLTDLAEEDAYRTLRRIVEPTAARMGSTVIWVMGNHDERLRFATDLYDEALPGDAVARSQDRVHDIDGLRIIALDSTVPGYHHGDITAHQLDWLEAELATAAPRGTLLALHHPPIPTPIDLMALLELRGQERLAEVIRETDVRGILAGHLHYATHSTFAGIPVSVAAATCYTMDLSAPAHSLSGIDGGQSFNLIQVYDDQVVHSVVPIGDHAQVSGFSAGFVEKLAALSPERRIDVFSNMLSTVSIADVEEGRA